MIRTTARVSRHAARPGFSILEVIFVLVIIGIIGSIVGYNLIGMADKAKIDATRQSMGVVQGALKSYYIEYSAYPPTGLLQTLVDSKRLEKMPMDAWNRPFEYYSPTTSYPYSIVSAGPDGQTQTPDDIEAHPEP